MSIPSYAHTSFDVHTSISTLFMGWKMLYVQNHPLKGTSINITPLCLFVGCHLHKLKWEQGVYSEHKSYRIIIIKVKNRLVYQSFFLSAFITKQYPLAVFLKVRPVSFPEFVSHAIPTNHAQRHYLSYFIMWHDFSPVWIVTGHINYSICQDNISSSW